MTEVENNECNKSTTVDVDSLNDEFNNDELQESQEFKFSVQISNHPAPDKTDSSSERDTELTREDLLEQIKLAQEELDRRKHHSQKIEELNAAVEEWKADFARALEQLHDKFPF